jgi:hypothetical protein
LSFLRPSSVVTNNWSVWPIRVELPFVYLFPFVIYHWGLFTLYCNLEFWHQAYSNF